MFSKLIAGLKTQNWRVVIATFCAIIFGVLTFILLVLDRSASAAVSAAMTGACVLTILLPVVDTIEVFGLKAKLVRQIDEGEHLLEKLRQTVSVLSKQVFLQAAFGNRMGGVPADIQKQNLDEVTSMLEAMEISSQDIENARSPVPAMFSFDLLLILHHTVQSLAGEKIAQIERDWQQQNGGQGRAANDPEFQSYQQKKTHFTYPATKFKLPPIDELSDISLKVETMVSEIDFRDDDVAKLQIVAEEVIKYSRECWANGFMTEEAQQYIEKYGGRTSERLRILKEDNPNWDAGSLAGYFE